MSRNVERVWRHLRGEKTDYRDSTGSGGMKCQHRIRQSAERLLVGANPEPPLKIEQRKEYDTMRKRNRTITIRCTDDEYERIHSKAERHKLSLSDFVLRSALDKKIVVADGLNESGTSCPSVTSFSGRHLTRKS